MAVFISYSHEDAPFVDRLATSLFKAKTSVWIDRWELRVGDSLIRRIEEAIDKATAFVFVLSKASVQSDWCRKELSAGLIRELEEKKVLVLPVLLEDCSVPLFLKDKKYADFRHNFDAGLADILNALASVTNDTQGRFEQPGGLIDWSSDWSVGANGIVTVQLVIVEHSRDYPFTLLSIVDIVLNEPASKRHLDLVNAGFEPFARQLVLMVLTDSPICDALFVYLEDAAPVVREFGTRDPKTNVEFRAKAVCRRLGVDTGSDIVLNLGNELRGVAAQSLAVLTPAHRPDPQHMETLRSIMKKYRPDLAI
jgi:hypothetical protein